MRLPRSLGTRLPRHTHALTQPHTHTLPTQCPVLSGELIPGATPHVVPAGDRTRVGRLATASATTELHARSRELGSCHGPGLLPTSNTCQGHLCRAWAARPPDRAIPVHGRGRSRGTRDGQVTMRPGVRSRSGDLAEVNTQQELAQSEPHVPKARTTSYVLS